MSHSGGERTGHGRLLRVRSTLAVVRDGIDFGRCSEDGVLTASASPIQVLVADSSVVEQGRSSNIVIGALSSLVVGTEAPTIAFAIFGDGEGMIGTGGYHGAVLYTRNLGRANQDTSLSFGVANNIVVGHSGNVDARLAAIEATPDKAPTIDGGGQGVVSTAGHVSDSVVFEVEIGDNGRGDDNGIVLASIAVNTSSAEGICAPGPDLLFAVNGK